METLKPERVRAVILTTQRTGSTFLVMALDSHPQIESAGEILVGAPDRLRAPYRGPFPRKVAKTARFVKSGAWLPGSRMRRFFTGGNAPVRVFKVMYNQLGNPFARRYLQGNTNIKVLHLRRRNLLKMHVSQLLLGKRTKPQTRESVPTIRVHVDPQAALTRMRRSRALYEQFEQLFAHHPRLNLTYEEMIDGQAIREEVADRVCGFLGVEKLPMTSALLKVNPDSLGDIVSNYTELTDVLSQSEFADLLE
jgi:hypothetical protein